jgi:hypothetical protein
MRNGRGGVTAGASALAAVVFMCGIGAALGGNAARRGTAEARALAAAAEAAKGPVEIETLSFGDALSGPLRVVRGPGRPASPPPAQPGRAETVSFGPGETGQVTVLRGGPASPADAPSPAPQTHSEKISFADPQVPAVTVVRGVPAPDGFSMYLFGPASGGELDRIAFAVDGVESRHGADPRMWRPEPDGPQGPMQVGAAAAFDVGGGDRFDLTQNRLLGRAYLAQMFRRYGNWPDALAAYNWGPGNMDLWIGGGRRATQLPLDVVRYVARVLRDAVITNAGL